MGCSTEKCKEEDAGSHWRETPWGKFSEESKNHEQLQKKSLHLVASLLLVAMPFAPSSVLAPSSKARSP